MRTVLFRLSFVFVLFFSTALFIGFGPSGLFQSLPIQEDTTIVIPPKTPLRKIAHILATEHVIKNEFTFIASAVLAGALGKIKAGEYLVPKESTSFTLATLLASGKTVIRKFTVVEGSTVAKVIHDLNENSVLMGEITDIPPEGFIMPETYTYVYHDSRQEVLNRMVHEMKKFLVKVWKTELTQKGIPSVTALLTLASVVEKETGVASERAQVAGVFMNRLRLNMPLQSDPTVIYALTAGATKLDRLLSRDDLAVASPYNTYKNRGLPPGPIACPGKASIMAVINPAPTNALYFVANGTGGHSFADSLATHNQNVNTWRKIQRESQQSEATLPQQEAPPQATLAAPQNVTTSKKIVTAKKANFRKTSLAKKIAKQRHHS